MSHNYEVTDYYNYAEMFKGQPFDPKRMPLGTDWKRVEVCSICNMRSITCGIFYEGKECPTSFALGSSECDASKKDYWKKFFWEIDHPGEKYEEV